MPQFARKMPQSQMKCLECIQTMYVITKYLVSVCVSGRTDRFIFAYIFRNTDLNPDFVG